MVNSKIKGVFIIAEAGVNHNGDLNLAKRLVDSAVESGASAIKFQSFHADKLVSVNAEKARYQIENTGVDTSQLEMLRKLELSEPNQKEIAQYCSKRGILFLSSPFDEASVDYLETLNVPMFKIASGEITNIPLLRCIAMKDRPIILSTGMSTLDEVREAFRVITSVNRRPITLLHCVSEYPAQVEDINLKAMMTMKQEFKTNVGYSDHTLGTEISLAAVALGATMIEKHLTLDRDMNGPDHRASLEVWEFRELVRQIRNIELALGSGVKSPAQSELANRAITRRSLFAAMDIPAESIISENMLECKRPGTGISALFYDKCMGRKVLRDIKAGEMLDWENLGGERG